MARPNLLVVVRHAESARNEAKKGSTYFADDAARQAIRGVADYKVPLTDRGVEQARQTGIALREEYGEFDYVYHSGYRRTIDTMEGILSAYTLEERAKMKIRHNLFLRERDPGYTYDMTEAEAEEQFPYLHDYWKAYGGFYAHPPGGESLAQVTERVYLFVNMLYRDRADKRILVFAHGGVIRCLRYRMERWDHDQALSWNGGEHVGNCGVTVYERNEKTAHLDLQTYNKIYWK